MKKLSILSIIILPIFLILGYSIVETYQHLPTKDLLKCTAVYKIYYDRQISNYFAKHRNKARIFNHSSFDFPSMNVIGPQAYKQSIYESKTLSDFQLNYSVLLCDITLAPK